jgi:hypothetical protein
MASQRSAAGGRSSGGKSKTKTVIKRKVMTPKPKKK